MKSLSAILFVALITMSFAEDLPYDYKRLRESRNNAIEKIDKKYISELKKLKIKYTKRGDLNNAVLIDEEINEYSKNQLRSYVSDVRGYSGHPINTRNNVYSFQVEELGKSVVVNFWASYDVVGSTFGKVYLTDEGGRDFLIYKWKTDDFKVPASSVKSFEDLTPISVNVEKWVKKPGKYKVKFVYSKGQSKLSILRVSLDVQG